MLVLFGPTSTYRSLTLTGFQTIFWHNFNGFKVIYAETSSTIVPSRITEIKGIAFQMTSSIHCAAELHTPSVLLAETY